MLAALIRICRCILDLLLFRQKKTAPTPTDILIDMLGQQMLVSAPEVAAFSKNRNYGTVWYWAARGVTVVYKQDYGGAELRINDTPTELTRLQRKKLAAYLNRAENLWLKAEKARNMYAQEIAALDTIAAILGVDDNGAQTYPYISIVPRQGSSGKQPNATVVPTGGSAVYKPQAPQKERRPVTYQQP